MSLRAPSFVTGLLLVFARRVCDGILELLDQVPSRQIMPEAMMDGQLVQGGSYSPDETLCPVSGVIGKRKRNLDAWKATGAAGLPAVRQQHLLDPTASQPWRSGSRWCRPGTRPAIPDTKPPRPSRVGAVGPAALTGSVAYGSALALLPRKPGLLALPRKRCG